MSSQFDFKNKNVVVVGGTSGINQGVAECFARAGARVAVASRSEEKVTATVELLEKAGAQAQGFCCDVRDAEALEKGLKGVHEAWGDIDVLISGAAGNFPALVDGLSSNGFKAVVDIDLVGTFHVMKAAYPLLRKPGASIVNISAPQAFLPMVAQAHVCSAKAGVDMITRCLALEWGPEGIRINSVVPGPIEETEGMKRLAPTPEFIEKARESVPLKRLGKKQDIGNTCLFLASEQASYINGTVIPVDGGWSLGGASELSNQLGEMFKQLTKAGR